MPTCGKCGRNEDLVTLYALGIPIKVCRNCGKLYQVLPTSLRKIYATTRLPITSYYGNTYCRVCGDSSINIFTISTIRYSKKCPPIRAYLCKRCSLKVKAKVI